MRVDGDLAASLPALTAALPPRTDEGYPTERVAAIRADILARCFARPPEARLAAQDAVEIARELLPEDGIMVSETGVFIVMLDHLWPVTRPDTFFGSGGARTMGLTVPAALGAKLARPDTPVLGIGGDGSLLMRLGELETFARTGAAVPLLIINDQAHGTIRSRQKTRGLDPYSLQFAPVDYAAIARASGLRGAIGLRPGDPAPGAGRGAGRRRRHADRRARRPAALPGQLRAHRRRPALKSCPAGRQQG